MEGNRPSRRPIPLEALRERALEMLNASPQVRYASTVDAPPGQVARMVIAVRNVGTCQMDFEPGVYDWEKHLALTARFAEKTDDSATS